MTHLSIRSRINEYDDMLSSADVNCCVSVKIVRMTLRGDKLCMDLSIRACNDLACSEELDHKHISVLFRPV